MGALNPTRDFNYVDDTVNGFLAVSLSDNAVGRVINIGSGREISIVELACTIMGITRFKADIVCDDEGLGPEKSEVNRLICDNSLARELIGWVPQYTLEQGLEETGGWIRDNIEHYRPGEYTL